MKRFLATLLALMLMLSVATVASAEEYSEHLDISLGNWDMTTWTPDDNPVAKIMQEQFNVDFTIMNLDWGNYEEQIMLWATADELPDVLAGRVTESYYPELMDQELLRTIPEEMLAKYPTVYEHWKNDYTSQQMYNYYGEIWALPRDDGYQSPFTGMYTGGNGLYFRKDWADKLGIEEPTNMAELLDMLTAFATQDPDGNGIDDTYGLATTFGRLTGIWSWFNCHPSAWIKTEEGYMPGFADKEPMVEALTWLRSAYQAGAIDPEWQGVVDGFVNGTFGAYVYHLDPGWAGGIMNERFMATNTDLEGYSPDYIGTLTCLPSTEGSESYTRPYFSNTNTFFTYDCSDEVMERMLAIYEWGMNPELGAYTANYGIEGEHWEWNEQGTITRLTDGRAQNGAGGGIARMWTWGGNYSRFMQEDTWNNYTMVDLSGMTNSEWEKYIYDEMISVSNAAAANPNVTFDLMAFLVTTDEKADFNAFDYQTGLMNIVIGTEDVATMYDAFIAEANAAGMQEAIDSVTEALG